MLLAMVAIQIDMRHRTRFGIGRIVMVGDRGMTTADRIRREPELVQLHWMPALRDADIRRLLRPPRRTGRLCAGRDRQSGLSRRMAGGVPEPPAAGGDAAQARVAGAGNRGGTGLAFCVRGGNRKVPKHVDIAFGMASMAFRRHDARIARAVMKDPGGFLRPATPAESGSGPAGRIAPDSTSLSAARRALRLFARRGRTGSTPAGWSGP